MITAQFMPSVSRVAEPHFMTLMRPPTTTTPQREEDDDGGGKDI